MKPLLRNALICLLSMPLVAVAQPHICGTHPGDDYANFYKQLREDASRTDVTHYRKIEYKVPIQLHLVRKSDGTASYSYEDVVRDLQLANAYFKEANLVFYLAKEINYIDDNRYYDFHVSTEAQLAPNHDVDGAINIYVVNEIRTGNGYLGGYTYMPQQKIDRMFISQRNLGNGVTLAHELGHYFSLIHTHGMSGIALEYADGSNCSSGGDLMCDTPADPRLTGKVDDDCNYTGNAVDAHGQPYAPDTRNIMAYSPSTCRDHFSEEQLAQMLHSFQNNRSNLTVTDNFATLPDDVNIAGVPGGPVLQMDVYPNPTNGVVYMDLNNDSDQEIEYRIALMDMTGRLVKETTTSQVNGGLASLDLTDLEKGMYMVNVQGNRAMTSHRVLYQ